MPISEEFFGETPSKVHVMMNYIIRKHYTQMSSYDTKTGLLTGTSYPVSNRGPFFGTRCILIRLPIPSAVFVAGRL